MMPIPVVTYGIIGVTALISILAFSNRALLEKTIFSPYDIFKNKSYGRFISHGFIHANWGHLLFNMITLYFFGGNVEFYFVNHFGITGGRAIYLILYIVAIIVSSIPAYVKHKNNSYYRSLGASGAVSAVLFASILIFPLSTLFILPIPFPIPAWLFGPLYLLYSYYMAKRGTDNIGHEAHFMGAVFGLAVTILLIPSTFARFLEQIASIL